MARQLGGLTDTIEAAASQDPRAIVIFPRELDRNPESAWLAAGSSVLHDVPCDDPAVFEFYCSRLSRQHPEHAAKFARLLDIEDRTVETSA